MRSEIKNKKTEELIRVEVPAVACSVSLPELRLRLDLLP